MKKLGQVICLFLLFLNTLLLSCNEKSSTHPDNGTYDVYGRTIDPAGTGIPGALITIRGLNCNKSVITDDNGFYSIKSVPVGLIILTATKDNYKFSPSGLRVEIINSDFIAQDIVGIVSVEVSGYVKTLDNRHVPGFFVSLLGNKNEQMKETLTDNNGFFKFSDITCGTYFISLNNPHVRGAGYPAQKEITVIDEHVDVPDFKLICPSNVIASYVKNSDEVRLRWEMYDSSFVKMYKVAWSDSNDFDFGRKGDEFTNSLSRQYSINATRVLKSMGYLTMKDSLIIYFRVSAVYQNNENIGPWSLPDSALISIK